MSEYKEILISDIAYNIKENSSKMMEAIDNKNDIAISYDENLTEFLEKIFIKSSEKDLAYIKILSDKLLRI